MGVKKLYQTLEDRGNIDYIEDHAPFPCNWPNTWLGNGYYFWDTFIENAHWWGNMRYTTKGKDYVICSFLCDFDNITCYDLVGETEHMSDFDLALQQLKKEKKLTEKTTVTRVLNYLKNTGSFKFEAIRVYGIRSISENQHEFRHRLIFEVGKPQYLDIKPAIQICIFKKRGLNLRNLKIEFPDEYNPDYLV